MSKKLLVLLAVLALSIASAQTLRVLTHSSFNASEEVLQAFTEETGIAVELIEGGDAGETLNRAILTAGSPLADLLFGVDNNLLARALAADLFEPYRSPGLEHVPDAYVFDAEGFVTPVDVGFVNFNYDLAYFEDAEQEAPSDLTDLTDEAYRGLTAVMNPATSSPGLAFMLATIARFGTEGDYTWLHYWADLRDNDVLVTDGWSDAYYTAFTRYGGDRPIVLSYATSPAAEVYYAEEELSEAPTANLFCEACAYRQVEGIGILRGTPNREAAERFIDFMLSSAFQQDIPLNMWVYPVSEQAELPDVFRFAEEPSAEQVATVPSDEIEANQRTWLTEWTRVVEQGQNP
jgi:thiamine transport system substrate-binding protein